MTDGLRFQRKCYFASPGHAESFWGKYIYIYQYKGSLRLTGDSLRLEGCPQAVAIPFRDIKSISVGRFSKWAKPDGLCRLTVCYSREGEPEAIHLVPHESPLDATQITNEIVMSWFETLGTIEELVDRVQPPPHEPEAPGHFRNRFLFAASLIAPPVILGLVGWLVIGL